MGLLPKIFNFSGKRNRHRLSAGRLLGPLMIAFLVALVFVPRFRYWIRSVLEYPLHYQEYKHFGIRIPNGYATHGIDVSRYQERIDWSRVKKMNVDGVRINFAFIKATEGSWILDERFDENWERCKANGIIRGAYHYFLPDISAKDQAEHFVRHVRLKAGDLPPVVDIEETRGLGKQQIQRYTRDFLKLLEKVYKVKPIVYTNRDFYKQYFAGQEMFKDCRYWIAHYHVPNLHMPGDAEWHFWQHSDRGNINGINAKVDFNVFNGDSVALRKLCL